VIVTGGGSTNLPPLRLGMARKTPALFHRAERDQNAKIQYGGGMETPARNYPGRRCNKIR
jgi:hypothetical protein